MRSRRRCRRGSARTCPGRSTVSLHEPFVWVVVLSTFDRPGTELHARAHAGRRGRIEDRHAVAVLPDRLHRHADGHPGAGRQAVAVRAGPDLDLRAHRAAVAGRASCCACRSSISRSARRATSAGRRRRRWSRRCSILRWRRWARCSARWVMRPARCWPMSSGSILRAMAGAADRLLWQRLQPRAIPSRRARGALFASRTPPQQQRNRPFAVPRLHAARGRTRRGVIGVAVRDGCSRMCST